MRTINLKKKKNFFTIEKIINNYKSDPIAEQKDSYNQNKLNKEIKKVLLYREKINNKPIDTSVLLKK